jgi:glucose/mannose transport system permease protein
MYGLLLGFAFLYLAPLYVMVITSVKSLDEIRSGGGLLDFPGTVSLEPWFKAWGGACVGVSCHGLSHYFFNSVRMVVPAVLLSTFFGALNGYILTKWRFPGEKIVFALILTACFIPFQVVLIPMAYILGLLGIANTTLGLVMVHVVYGIGFATLFFRNFYENFPTELIRAAQMDGADFWRIFWRIILPNSRSVIIVTIIYQFTNIWNDFLFGSSFASGEAAPVTVALNNIVNTSMGVKEYNVDMAAALIAALPTLIIYACAGRYFMRGLMSGAVKG